MNMSLKKQLSIMAAIAIIAVVLLGFVSYLLAKNTTIGSQQYVRINNANNLTADVAPPPLFMLEAMMHLQELASVHGDERADLIKEVGKHFVEYNERLSYWQANNNLPPEIKEFILKTLNPVTQDFINHAEITAIVAAKNNDDVKLTAALGELIKKYEKHCLYAINKGRNDINKRKEFL